MKYIDMHCDTIMVLCNNEMEKKAAELRDNSHHIDLNKLKLGNYLGQCFAMFVPFSVPNPLETCMEMIDKYYREIEKNKDLIAPVLKYDDFQKNIESNKLSAILTIEEGGVVKGNLAFLRDFYRLGVRMITLTWNYENGIGYPNFKYVKGEKPNMHIPNSIDGLTPFGIEMVEEMNRLGIVIDVSHLSDAGFWDVIKYSRKPIVASHSNSRSICPNVRNLTDEMIMALAKNKGVMGINYCQSFVNEDADKTYIKDLVKHIKHIVEVGGIDIVGLGSDFDGIGSNLEMSNASMLPLLEKALQEEGFSSEDIDKIAYKNVLRVFKEVWK